MKSKIIQLAVTNETEGDYPKLLALTSDGEVYLSVLSPGIVKGDEENWRKIQLPLELKTP